MAELRISDADRESAVDLLSEQYALGRLTKDEFDERSDAVWSAKTRGDLAPIFVDLPVRTPGRQVPAVQRDSRRRRGFRPSLVPLVLVLVAIVVITEAPLLLLLLVLFFWFGHGRSHSWGRCR